MSQDETTIDGYDITVKRAGITITFNLTEVMQNLDEDGRMRVAEMVTWGPVLKEALRRLAFESDSWSSDDVRTREEWLIVIGEEHAQRVKNAEERRDAAWAEIYALKEKARSFASHILAYEGAGLTDNGRRLIGILSRIEDAETPAPLVGPGGMIPRGFLRRKGATLLRSHVDLPEDEAAAVVAIADEEQARTGERVSVQVVIRRFVRAGLASAARRNRTALDVPPMSPPPQPETPDPASTGTSGEDGGGP